MKPYKSGFGPYAPEIYRMPYAYCYRCTFGLEYPSCELHCAYYLKEFFNTHISAGAGGVPDRGAGPGRGGVRGASEGVF